MSEQKTSEKKKFAERLNQAMDSAGLPKKGMGRQSTLVKLLGVGHRQAKRWLEGEEFPPTSKLVKIAQATGVRSNWLLSGYGEMLPTAGNDISDYEIKQEATELSKDAFEVASAWMRLPYEQRLVLKKVIDELVDVEIHGE
jgi:phage repressor protein C with HTH and peptisase S24 domain